MRVTLMMGLMSFEDEKERRQRILCRVSEGSARRRLSQGLSSADAESAGTLMVGLPASVRNGC